MQIVKELVDEPLLLFCCGSAHLMRNVSVYLKNLYQLIMFITNLKLLTVRCIWLSLFLSFSFGDNQQPKNEHVMVLVGSLICVQVFWNYDDIFALPSKCLKLPFKLNLLIK
jgi:hypothetical protein